MGNLDQLKARIGLGHTPISDENPTIETLASGSARGLRLPWLSHFNEHTLAVHLAQSPGLSVWVPRTGEYLVGESWRHRDEIANVVEVTARKGREALLRAALARYREQGFRLVLLSDEVWREQTGLYQRLGFGRIESIVFFRKSLRRDDPALSIPGLAELEYSLVDAHSTDAILEVDHASFPWLWWNSAAELEAYMQMPGVFVLAARHEGQTVGYASYTMYHGWAHLDRLAVAWPFQGRRYGAAQLAHVLGVMVNSGAESVALSTQETNYRSHGLYLGFGFRQSSERMHFYGSLLDSGVRLDLVSGR